MTATEQRQQGIDGWASGSFTLRTSRQAVLLWILGAPALLPLILIAPAVVTGLVTGHGEVAHGTGNDVLGSGGALLLLATLAVTPLRTMTRRQWFVPLRRWYGVMFAVTIFADAAIASNDPQFAGPVVAGRLAGHTFLMVGSVMTLLLVPLFVQGVWNSWSMRQLGSHWKPVQRYGTYAVWALLGLHLALLDGFGIAHADANGPDRFPWDVAHQRLYQFAACSAVLVTLRLPPMRHWVRARHDAGQAWQAWLAIAPLIVLFCLGYAFFANELRVKGIAAFTLSPVSD